MWHPAQMARWFEGLNATHSHPWELCVWNQALCSVRVAYSFPELLYAADLWRQPEAKVPEQLLEFKSF